MEDHNRFDVCVIGGGLMGSAVALGLVRSGARVLMVDKISRLQTASKGNFGLVWSQSKGSGNRDYSRFSEKAVLDFTDFALWLEEESGIDIELRLGAGLILCIGDRELAARTESIKKFHHEAELHGERHPSIMVNQQEVQKLVGKTALGEEVSGGSFSSVDGDVNPLLLLKAMRRIFIKLGGVFLGGCLVNGIKRRNRSYHLETSSGKIVAAKIVLAAGFGNIPLIGMMGEKLPLIVQKGQLLVTERVKPFLSLPFSCLRQTGCGSVIIGYTQENTGFETGTTVSAAVQLAQRAVRIFPGLRHIRVVRSWASLRIMTEDDLPIYDEINGYPGCYVLATHSCVTLASLHMSLLPSWILGGKRPDIIRKFKLERFNV
ncbi:MAG: FAD-binding oxidoreductase [Deltaproteobacteria bacterium]|nr:FAD-binding oxidoreductase [Deltaproteobacteria bacterium]